MKINHINANRGRNVVANKNKEKFKDLNIFVTYCKYYIIQLSGCGAAW